MPTRASRAAAADPKISPPAPVVAPARPPATVLPPSTRRPSAVQLLAVGHAAGNRAARNWLVAQRLADDSDIVQEAPEEEGTAASDDTSTADVGPVPEARVTGLDAPAAIEAGVGAAPATADGAGDASMPPELDAPASALADAGAPASEIETSAGPPDDGLDLDALPEDLLDAAVSMEDTLDGGDDDDGAGSDDAGEDAGAPDDVDGADGADSGGAGDGGGAGDAGGDDSASPEAIADDAEWAAAADTTALIAAAVEPIALDLDGEQHTVDLEVEGGRLEPVLHTTRSTLTAIRAELAAAVASGAIAAVNAAALGAFATADARDALLTAAETALDGRRAERDHARDVVDRAWAERNAARDARDAAQDRGRGAGGAGGGRGRRDRSRSRDRRDRSRSPRGRGGAGGRRAVSPETAFQDADDAYRDARADMRAASDAFHTARVNATVAAGNYETAAAAAINVAWQHHRAHLRLHLMPAGAMFQDQAVAGGLTLADYHAGTGGDPIPIVWYKAPTDYPSITQNDGTVVAYPGPATIDAGAPLRVTGANQLAVGSLVTKVAHNDSRVTQQAINDRINLSGGGPL